MGQNAMQMFVDIVQGRPFLLLVVLTIVPFVAVNAIISPLADGVHGSVHSDYDTEVRFDGTIDGVPYNGTDPPSSGHFRGDLRIGDSTGWVICNGMVRFSGTLVISDAEFDYSIDSNRTVTAPGNTVRIEKDFQHIALDGTEGEMQGGVPFWCIGLIGSAAGAVAWAAWLVFRRRRGRDGTAAIGLIAIGVVSSLNVFFLGPLYSPVCVTFMIVPIIVVLVLALVRPLREDIANLRTDLRHSSLPEVQVLLGIAVIVASSGMVRFAGYGSIDGYTHETGAAWRALSFGLFGVLVGAANIGFGLGKRYQRHRMPRPVRGRRRRERPPPEGTDDTTNVYGLEGYRPMGRAPPPPPEDRGPG